MFIIARLTHTYTLLSAMPHPPSLCPAWAEAGCSSPPLREKCQSLRLPCREVEEEEGKRRQGGGGSKQKRDGGVKE